MTRLISLLFLLYIGCIFATTTSAQAQPLPADQEIPLRYGADRLGKRQDAAMQRFRDHRLGLFIHWGLYSIPGGEWKGKVYSGAAEWLKSWANVPSDEWMQLDRKSVV